MKRLICLFVLTLIAVNVHALNYTIVPGSGYSEPLNNGDIIEIGTTVSPSAGHTYSDSWWRFYYNSIELGQTYTTFNAFYVNPGTGTVTGNDALAVDIYTSANRVRLIIGTSFGVQQYIWPSDNYLEVLPTSPMTPSTSAWGLIALLISIPVVIIWRR